jgi:hypothetical protein
MSMVETLGRHFVFPEKESLFFAASTSNSLNDVFELHKGMDKVDTCGIHRQIKLDKTQSAL